MRHRLLVGVLACGVLTAEGWMADGNSPVVRSPRLLPAEETRATNSLADRERPAVGAIPGRRVSAKASLEETLLYGSIHRFAYYFLDLLIGLPAQRQSVIIDSGSSILGFPCSQCERCGRHLDPAFDFSKSDTAQWIPCSDNKCFSNMCSKDAEKDFKHCDYQQYYSEGSSLYGHYFSDVISLEDRGNHENTFVRYDYIGCHTRETNLFTSQRANGIMGIAFPKGGKQPSALDAIWMRNSDVNTRVVAICLADEGGLLTVGGFNEDIGLRSLFRLRTTPTESSDVKTTTEVEIGERPVEDTAVVWTEISSKRSYSVHLDKLVAPDGSVLGTVFGNAIVDSGTTYSYLPSAVYVQVDALLKDACTEHTDLCAAGVDLSHTCVTFPEKEEFSYDDALDKLDDSFPKLTFVFRDGASFKWRPRSYFFSKGTVLQWCIAIDDNHMEETALGMSFMKNVNVIFDRDNDQIGFMPSACPRSVMEDRPALSNVTDYKHVTAEKTLTAETPSARERFSHVFSQYFFPSDLNKYDPHHIVEQPINTLIFYGLGILFLLLVFVCSCRYLCRLLNLRRKRNTDRYDTLRGDESQWVPPVMVPRARDTRAQSSGMSPLHVQIHDGTDHESQMADEELDALAEIAVTRQQLATSSQHPPTSSGDTFSGGYNGYTSFR